MSSRLEEVVMNKDNNHKLSTTALAIIINRDTLSRQIPQEVMLKIEFFMNHFRGTMYGLLERSIHKDQENIDKLQETILDLMRDFKLMQNLISNMDIPKDE